MISTLIICYGNQDNGKNSQLPWHRCRQEVVCSGYPFVQSSRKDLYRQFPYIGRAISNGLGFILGENLIFFIYFFNKDISLDISLIRLNFSLHVDRGHLAGSMSQIFF